MNEKEKEWRQNEKKRKKNGKKKLDAKNWTFFLEDETSFFFKQNNIKFQKDDLIMKVLHYQLKSLVLHEGIIIS
jgi:hypothetical protein